MHSAHSHSIFRSALAFTAILGACGDDDDGGGTPAGGTKLALTVDNQSSHALSDISVGFLFYTEADGFYVPAPKIGAAASQTLTIDTAAMLAKLEASPLGVRGAGIGMLIAFHDHDHDGVMAGIQDYIGASQDVAAYFIGKNWDCAAENLFAADEDNIGFECEVGVQIGEITQTAQCSGDPESEDGCVCETHDRVVELEPLPATLTATVHVFDTIPCGKSPNLD